MRLSIIEGALATSMGTLLSGVFLTGFALSLGANRVEVGILAALPALSNVAQLVGSFWLERGARRKTLCVGALATSRVAWLPMLLVPAIAACVGPRYVALVLIAIVAVSSVLSAIGGVAWLSWIRDLVPQQERIGFLALRNQFDTALALSMSIAGAAFADWWNLEHPGSTAGYMLVFGVGMLAGLVGVRLLNRIPDPGMREAPAALAGPGLFFAPLKNANFRMLIGAYASWSFATNLAIPFFAVFMLQNLRLPLWQITLLYTLSSVVGLAASRFWARLGERFGAKPVILIASVGEALFPLWWLFLTPHSSWALPLIFLTGVFGSPLATGSNNLLLATVPARSATPYMAVFSAVVGPLTAAAAVAGGCLAESFAGSSALSLFSIDSLKLVFLLSFLGRMASLLMLGAVRDPGSQSVATVLRYLVGGKPVETVAETVDLPPDGDPSPPVRQAA